MNIIIEYILFALALCVDSFAVSTTSALKTKLSWRRGFLLAFTFALFQGGFPLIGALAGAAAKQYVESVDHWIAFGLLLLVGGKMIWDAFHDDEPNKALDLSRYWVICTLAVATSIDAFVVGIGLGLELTTTQLLWQCFIIALATFLVSLLGVLLGRQQIPVSERGVTIFGGIVLIGLGAKILLEHLCFA